MDSVIVPKPIGDSVCDIAKYCAENKTHSNAPLCAQARDACLLRNTKIAAEEMPYTLVEPWVSREYAPYNKQ